MANVKNLITLSSDTIKSFINSIDNIVCDVDGVIWDIHGELVEGIPKTLEKLRNLDKNIYFVSNNNILGIKHLCQNLRNLMPDLPEDHVVNPCVVVISYLKTLNFDKKLLVLGSTKMKEDFVNAGFKLADTGPAEHAEDLGTFISEMGNVQNIGAVVYDFDFNLNLFKISKFLNCIINKDVLFLTASDEQKSVFVGKTVLFAVGSLLDIFTQITNRLPMCFGKPYEPMQNYVNQMLNDSNPSKTLFVGDMLDLDIKMGKKCGFKTLLVLTGIAQLDDLQNCKQEEIPDFYIPALGDLCNYI